MIHLASEEFGALPWSSRILDPNYDYVDRDRRRPPPPGRQCVTWPADLSHH